MLTTQLEGISEAIRSVRGRSNGASARQAELAAKLQRDSVLFSNLLISGINEHHNSVEQERKNQDLLERLRKDFDWGRQTCKKCFADHVARRIEDLYDERAWTSAGQCRALLRSNDTGPSV